MFFPSVLRGGNFCCSVSVLKNNINAAVTIQQEAHQNGIAEDLLKRSVILRLSNSTRKGSNQAAESGISEDASEGVSSKST